MRDSMNGKGRTGFKKAKGIANKFGPKPVGKSMSSKASSKKK